MAALSPDDLGDLLGEAVGHRLGDERLAAPGRAVEQDALRCGEPVLGEQLVVHERQLDRVGDLLDLTVEATDVVVGDVGHLLEHELLDLGAGQLLEQEPGARVEQHRVSRAEGSVEQLVDQLTDPLFVGPPDDQGRVRRRGAP